MQVCSTLQNSFSVENFLCATKLALPVVTTPSYARAHRDPHVPQQDHYEMRKPLDFTHATRFLVADGKRRRSLSGMRAVLDASSRCSHVFAAFFLPCVNSLACTPASERAPLEGLDVVKGFLNKNWSVSLLPCPCSRGV